MIRDLPSTSTREVSKELVRLRNQVGAMAMGRVLTLLVSVDDEHADDAIQAANDATRQHPARILVLVLSNSRGRGRLDAQIRVGGDAGASEIVVLRLYGQLTRQEAAVVTPLLLPDSPIVAWWPQDEPADVAASPLGQMAHRRITDAARVPRPATQLRRRGTHYVDGDTDLAWTRVTRWRALLASALESAPDGPVEHAYVTAEPDHASAGLLAGWLASSLGCPVTRVRSAAGTGLVSVRLDRASGRIDLVRGEDGTDTATLVVGANRPRLVALRTPSLPEVLAEELRRLDADEVYARALCEGLPLVRRGGTRSAARRAGEVPAAAEELDAPHPEAVGSASLAGRDPSPDRDERRVRDLVDESLAHDGPPAPTAEVRVHTDRGALAAAVADALVARVDAAARDRGVAHVVLTGGSMGNAVMEQLSRRARAGELDEDAWSVTHLWWGDERLVPADDADRNDGQAEDAGLGDLPVPGKNVHRVPAGSGPDAAKEAAARYAARLAREAARGQAAPVFDVVMLGMGPDTHVASLFPGHPQVRLLDEPTAAVPDSPKPPPVRVTMTVPTLCSSSAVWLVVSGADKADAVATATRAQDEPDVPASMVHGRRETVWWLDEDAAARLD